TRKVASSSLRRVVSPRCRLARWARGTGAVSASVIGGRSVTGCARYPAGWHLRQRKSPHPGAIRRPTARCRYHAGVSRLLPRLLVLALLLAAVLLALRWGGLDLAALKQQLGALRHAVDEAPLRAALLYVAAYVLACALSLPGAAVLTLAGGALFGLVLGTLLASVASTLGALAAFLLARWLFADTVRRRFARNFAAVDRGVARDGAFHLASLRLVPLVPFVLVNLLMALTPIRAWTFAGVSLVAMLPATVAYVYAGTALASVDAPGDVLSPRLLLA